MTNNKDQYCVYVASYVFVNNDELKYYVSISLDLKHLAFYYSIDILSGRQAVAARAL